MSELRSTAAPAGWYPDPHGLPQQRWWTGEQWTHAVAPTRQEPARAPIVTGQPTPREAFALPATVTPEDAFPTRRQLREQELRAQAARDAERTGPAHPASPFPMPAAVPVAAAPAAAVPATPVPAAPMSAAASAAPLPTPVAVAVPVAPVAALAIPAPAAAWATPSEAAPTPAWATAPASVPASAAAPVSSLSPALASAPAVAGAPAAYAAPLASAPVAAPASLASAPAVSQYPSPVLAQPGQAATAEPATLGASWPFQPKQSVSTAFEPAGDVPYEPFGMIPKITAGTAAPPDRVQTWEVWAIALMPAVILGVAVAIVTQLAEFYTTFMQGGLAFIFVLITIALAVRDRRALVQFGHAKTAHPALILLTPLVYLLVRSVKAHGSAGRESAPLIVWLVLVAAISALAFAFPEWLTMIVSTSTLI